MAANWINITQLLNKSKITLTDERDWRLVMITGCSCYNCQGYL